MFVKVAGKKWGWKEKYPNKRFFIGDTYPYNGESDEELKIRAEKAFEREVEWTEMLKKKFSISLI